MNLSKRVQKLKTSPIRKLVPFSEAATAAGKKIYYLNIGQPDIHTPSQFYSAIKEYSAKTLKYEHSAGLKELIYAIQKYYAAKSIEYSSQEILITNGGSEALLYTLLSVCDESDSILVPEPYYANYNSFFDILGIKLNSFTTFVDQGFHLPSVQDMEKCITGTTKALLLSNPSNPTGVVYTQQEMNSLAQLAVKHDLFIISDEVYREFVYGDRAAISFGSFKDISDRVILIDSISKRFSACGARIGCIISKNKQVMDVIYKLCQSRLSSPTLEMVGATALYSIDDSYFKTVTSEYKKRRDVLFTELSSIPGVKASEPEGAFYSIVQLPVKDAEKFTIWLVSEFDVNNETIMLTPAAGFYNTVGLGSNEVRISYAINVDDLKKSMHILKKGLERYLQLN